MNDKELADRVVELGVGQYGSTVGFELYYPPQKAEAGILITGCQSDEFVRDWRVAGALMEKVTNKPHWWEVLCDRKMRIEVTHRVWLMPANSRYDDDCVTIHARNESLPRAIIEACCEALEGTSDE